jgi:hypothetical protein
MILAWDFYEIRSAKAALHGIKLRGRIRKFTMQNDVSCLMENASDEDNVVRFALLSGSDSTSIMDFVTSLVPDALVTQSLRDVPNPVLSKLNINDASRYEI